MPPAPKFFVTSAALRAWFEENHTDASELDVGFYKTLSGRQSITWPQAVDEALCFGWIDGVRKRLDIDVYVIRFTPRQPTSLWTAINVAKIEVLREAGKVCEAGELAYARRTVEKTGVSSFARADAARFSKPQLQRFKQHPLAWAFFEMQPPWYRRTAAHWVTSARQEITREDRMQILVADSTAGRRTGPVATHDPAKQNRSSKRSRRIAKPPKR